MIIELLKITIKLYRVFIKYFSLKIEEKATFNHIWIQSRVPLKMKNKRKLHKD